MKNLLLICLIVVILSSNIFGQLKNYNDKSEIEILGTSTKISISGFVETKLKETEQFVGLIAAAGAILPPVIDLIVKNIERKAKKDALAYTGQYKGLVSGDSFYKSNLQANLPILTVKRTILTTAGSQDAVDIELIPEISADKTAFRYTAKEKFIYNWSVAKTTGDYDFVDVDLEIKFKQLFIEKGVYKIGELRTTTIQIPLVHVGKTQSLPLALSSGWIPLPTRSNGKKLKAETKTEEKTVSKTSKDGKVEVTKEKTSVDKSDDEEYENFSDNTGTYEVEISVTESNPYKIRAEDKKEIIETSSAAITQLIKAISESLLKKQEDEKK